MPSLLEQQHRLGAALLDANLAEFAPGVAVYRHAYRARLEGALRANYPVLAAILGREAFRDIANRYAVTDPSRHASIRWYGEHLYSAMPTVPLAELARMEWALGLAFDAADRLAIDAGSLSAIDPGRWATLPLALHPAARVLTMAWDIERLWESARDHPAGPWEEPRPHRHALLVWRMGSQAHWRVASEDEGQALRSLANHGTLEAACARAETARAEAIGGWFALWVRDGLLTFAEDCPR